jgi:hypothetical protein
MLAAFSATALLAAWYVPPNPSAEMHQFMGRLFAYVIAAGFVLGAAWRKRALRFLGVATIVLTLTPVAYFYFTKPRSPARQTPAWRLSSPAAPRPNPADASQTSRTRQ